MVSVRSQKEGAQLVETVQRVFSCERIFQIDSWCWFGLRGAEAEESRSWSGVRAGAGTEAEGGNFFLSFHRWWLVSSAQI